MKTKLFFSIAFLIAGIALFIVGRREANLRSHIEKNGISMPGTVLGVESHRTRRATLFDMNVAYQSMGTTHRKKFPVPRSFAEKHISAAPNGARALVPNATVEVRFLPADPLTSMIVGADPGSTSMTIFGVVFMLAGLGLGVWAFTGTKSPAHSVPQSIPQTDAS
jgi:hypothetical protein